MIRTSLPIALILITALASAAPAQEVLTNEEVLRMTKAGLPAQVITAKIRSSETQFDTSVDALVALSDAGVDGDVIAAMTGPSRATEPTPTDSAGQPGELIVRQGASQAANVRSNFEGTACTSPGIFLDTNGSLSEIDPTTYTQGKTGGAFVSRITYGIKSMKSHAIMRGTSSPVSSRTSDPVFWFCFEESESGLSYETKGATNPSEFLLVALTINEKKRERSFVAGKLNAWTGAQSGARPKALRDVNYEKVKPGVYRVTMYQPLEAGEFGFYYAGSAPLATYGFAGASSGNKIFTFGVR